MPSRARSIPKSTRFEDALEELEGIVRALESGEQSLEDSLAQFERGVSLSRFCKRSLAEAEQQVKVLLADEEGERLVDLDEGGGERLDADEASSADALRGDSAGSVTDHRP